MNNTFRGYAEVAIFLLFKKNYPHLTIIPNDRTQLFGFELDIWIKELNTGIEYNGASHFEPIYGQAALNKTRENDRNKREIAKLKNINLITIKQDKPKISHPEIINKFQELCQKLKLPSPRFKELSYNEIMEEKSRFTN